MKKLANLLVLTFFVFLMAGCNKKSSDENTNILLGASDSLQITISNQSVTYPDDSIYFSVMGADKDNNTCWVDAHNKLIPVKMLDNTIPIDGQNYCNYFHQLSTFRTIKLAYLNGARIRFSIGKPMRIRITSDNPNAGFTDADWNNPLDPNQNIIYDKTEFSYVSGILYINTTNVDYLGIPLKLSALINGDSVKVGMKASRSEIFSEFRNQTPADFQKLVKGDYRIVAPHKTNGSFNPDYFQPYIDSVWTLYKTDSLIMTGVSPAPWTAVGKVNSSDVFVFKFTSTQFYNETVEINKPTSSNVFACDGDGSLKTDGSKPLSHQKLIPKIAGALNRTVLYGFDYQKGCDTSAFYKRPVTNWFSKILHRNSIENRCYGFPFDDDCEQSSLFPGGSVKQLTITITKF
jgi:hypothetical protein